MWYGSHGASARGGKGMTFETLEKLRKLLQASEYTTSARSKQQIIDKALEIVLKELA